MKVIIAGSRNIDNSNAIRYIILAVNAAVWDGKSKGTKNMIASMRKRKKPVFVYSINKDII
jgi:hypothetical protein